eukprot:TRINITY_DN3132_c0_g1_i2.p1 TRINITY_DN3132_c0_g1~~TRINITY_DN3132_c0_g1_i2.p1  ORF type:complete len:427 (+),score=65.02 TRINITY_DN3132_c0_g1_i2:89-1369(+)
MISSLFIMSTGGCVVIEKHWKGKIPRQVTDDFFADYIMTCDSPKDVLPVVYTGRYIFVHVLQGDLIFLAVLKGEAPVMMVLEILQQIVSIFEKYFDDVTEDTIRDNFVTAYEVLEEVLDDGFPMSVEIANLKELVPPPSISRLLRNMRPGDTQPSSSSAFENTSTPWRRHGVKYSNNEMFFDIIEELHTVIDNDGKIISSEVQGTIQCDCRLSGMPDVVLQFKNSSVLEDVAFHPCVRRNRFNQDSALGFTPPDGPFVLARYTVFGEQQHQVPFYVKPQISFGEGGGRVSIMLGYKGSFNPIGKKESHTIDVKLIVPLPSTVDSCTLDQSQGSAMFDYSTREIVWEVKKLSSTSSSTPTLTADVHVRSDAPRPSVIPPVIVEYSQLGTTFSDLKVDSVNVLNEAYKPYKGVRYLSKAGHFVIRSSG